MGMKLAGEQCRILRIKKKKGNEDENGGERTVRARDRVKNPRKFNFEAVLAGSAVYQRVGGV